MAPSDKCHSHFFPKTNSRAECATASLHSFFLYRDSFDYETLVTRWSLLPELSKQREVFWCLYLCMKPCPFISPSSSTRRVHIPFLSTLSLKCLESWLCNGVPRRWEEQCKQALGSWIVGAGKENWITCQLHYVYGERVLPFAVWNVL